MMLGKMLRSIKRLWVTIGIALLILIALEALAWLAYATRDNRRNASLTRLQATQAYAGAHWFEEYARELSRARAEWRSYTYWREAPYHGKFINIDERGLRRTWNRSPAPSPGDLRVYMLGGSGMWGLGARDDFTIPSLVSKKLNSAGVRDLWFVNYGEQGYVSTQNVIVLMLELQRGNVPQVVVFLDGYNDVQSALETRPGLPRHEYNRTAEFNLRQRLNWRGYVERRALYKVLRSIAGGERVQAEGNRGLADAVVDVYLGNVRLVQALAEGYGFSAVFFWQPVVHDKKSPTPWEEWLRRRGGEAFAREVNQALERKLRGGTFGNVYDLSHVFDREKGTVFIDPVHVNETGYDMMAEVAARVIERWYKEKRLTTSTR